MAAPIVHILNGDALKSQFPDDLGDNIIVVRETLSSGNVYGESIDELMKNRATYMKDAYDIPIDAYNRKTRIELKKITKIENGAAVNLWFEDDVFCQVNFWFVTYLLNKNYNEYTLYLIRPNRHTQYGFSAYDKAGLIELYRTKNKLQHHHEIANLWSCIQNKEYEKLSTIAAKLGKDLSFIQNAAEAYLQSIPTENNLGRPTNTLIQIMEELDTKDFGRIFQAFCQRESIYGYGDLQVKLLYDKIIEHHSKQEKG